MQLGSLLTREPEAARIARSREESLAFYKMSLAQSQRKGEQLGLEVGLRKGEHRLVEMLLQQKFGDLPPEARRRLDSATEEQLGFWAKRLLSATTLEDVFG